MIRLYDANPNSSTASHISRHRDRDFTESVTD